MAALAPRPVICTEGGLDRDFQLISAAYRTAGAPDHFQYRHQPRFADPAQRWHGEHLPAGLDRDAFFRLANVDPSNHFFKKRPGHSLAQGPFRQGTAISGKTIPFSNTSCAE